MRIVTRPDFDGVVCVVLLHDVEKITATTQWVEPNEMQKGSVDVHNSDIIANLPYHENCSIWFDHHYSNKPKQEFKGAYEIVPSAARVIFKYYAGQFKTDFTELVEQADKIDSADLSEDEVLYPEKYPYVLLSMSVSGRDDYDEAYWNLLVDLLGRQKINQVLKNPKVKEKCDGVIVQNHHYRDLLMKYTRLEDHVSITDFRSLEKTPPGNRFLCYSLFPDSHVNVKIRNENDDPEKLIVSVGHSIFNHGCNVNVGRILADFEGGGHEKAGACSFEAHKSDDYIPKILEILKKNEN